jgi:hypothetical protein
VDTAGRLDSSCCVTVFFDSSHDADRGVSSSSRAARGFLLGVPNMSLVALA